MTPDLAAVKARIRALLAKTVANGCTEGEALASAEKAMQMMRDYGLSEDELTIERARHPMKHRRTVLDDLWPSVATACRCRTLLRSQWLEYIGPSPWPEIAVWLQGRLTEAHARSMEAYRVSPAYRRRRVARTRATARRQYTVGWVEGVRRKLADLVALDWDSLKRALAVVDRVLAPEMKDTRTLPGLGKASNARDAARDREAGEEAGLATSVNWAMQHKQLRCIGGPS